MSAALFLGEVPIYTTESPGFSKFRYNRIQGSLSATARGLLEGMLELPDEAKNSSFAAVLLSEVLEERPAVEEDIRIFVGHVRHEYLRSKQPVPAEITSLRRMSSYGEFLELSGLTTVELNTLMGEYCLQGGALRGCLGESLSEGDSNQEDSIYKEVVTRFRRAVEQLSSEKLSGPQERQRTPSDQASGR